MLNGLKWVGVLAMTGAMAMSGFVMGARLLQPNEVTFGTQNN